MQHLTHWFQQQKLRQDRIVSIFAAAMTNKMSQYLFYRLRYFSFNALILSACYLIEFYFIYYYMARGNAQIILAFRFLTIGIPPIWWSMTERLRTQIRNYRDQNYYDGMSAKIKLWLGYSLLIVFFLFVAIIIAIVYWSHHPVAHAQLLNRVYIITILLQVAVSLPIRVLHSAIYALRRISRPFLSLSIAHLLTLLLIIFTYPVLKDYCLAFSYLIGAIITTIISLYYTLRMNRIINILPRPLVKLPIYGKRINFKKAYAVRFEPDMLILMLVGISLAVPFFLTFYVFHYHANIINLAAIFLISQQFYQVGSWPQLFYFDFKKLASPFDKLVKKKLDDSLYPVAIIIAGIMWLLSAYLLYLFFGWSWLIVILLPIYILRSLYGLKVMQKFCSEDYLSIVISALIAILVIYAAKFFHSSHHFFIILVFLALATFYIYFLARSNDRVTIESSNDGLVPYFFVWCNQVAVRSQPTRILGLEFFMNFSKNQRNMINVELSKIGSVTYLDAKHALFMLKDPLQQDKAHIIIANIIKGLTSITLDTGSLNDGKEALQILQMQLRKKFFLAHEPKTTLPQLPLKNPIIFDLEQPLNNNRIEEVKDYGQFMLGALHFLKQPRQIKSILGYYVVAELKQDCLIKIILLAKNQVKLAELLRWSDQLILQYIELASHEKI